MSGPYVIGTTTVATGTSLSVPVTTPTSQGDVIYVACGQSVVAATVSSVGPDTQGNVYRQLSSSDTNLSGSVWIADSSTNSGGTKALGTSDSIPVTYASSSNTKLAAAIGISGVAGPVSGATPVDFTVTPTTGTSNSPEPASQALP